jgi:hypothetical protein
MDYSKLSLVRRKLVLVLAYTGGFVFLVYTFLHEIGHALVGIYHGGQLASFSINFLDASAHTGISGLFTASQRSQINLSGPAMPLLMWLVFILFAPKRANPVLELVKTISSAGVLGSLLPWILVPLVYSSGGAPPGDDVTQFLRNTGMSPLLLSGLTLGLFALGAAVFVRRSSGEAIGMDQITRWLRSEQDDPESLRAKFTLASMALIMMLLILVAVGMQFYLV